MNQPSPNTVESTAHPEAGFTLIEMIASLVIAAIAMALMATSVSTFASSWAKQTGRVETTDNLARGIAVLRRDIRQMRMAFVGPAKQEQLAFTGQPARIMFIARQHHSQLPPRLEVVAYGLRDGPDGVQLVRRSGSFDPKAPISEAALERPVVVLGNLSRAGLSYRGVGEYNSGWQSSWQNSEQLPTLVRLRLQPLDRSFPDIVMRIAGNIEQTCIVSRTGRCKPEGNGTPAQHRRENSPPQRTLQ